MKFIKPYVACAAHAYLLVVFGIYQFYDGGEVIDLLVPVVFGVPILTMNTGVQYGTKASINICLFLSALSVGVLAYFLLAEVKKLDYLQIGMKTVIIFTGILAFVSLLLFKIQRTKELKRI